MFCAIISSCNSSNKSGLSETVNADSIENSKEETIVEQKQKIIDASSPDADFFWIKKSEKFSLNSIHYEIYDNEFSDGRELVVVGHDKGIHQVEIPSKIKIDNEELPVTIIGRESFVGNEDIGHVTIGGCMDRIGYSAFANCRGLCSIEMPDGLEDIAENAFSTCIKLEQVVIPNSVFRIGSFAFTECFALKSVTLPNTLYRIEDATFFRCSALESISLPSKLHYIGNGAFGACHRLKDIQIPDSVVEIGHQAFQECTSFQRIVVPNKVSSIGGKAFMDCKNLRELTLGKSVEVVEDTFIAGCYGLRSLKVLASIPPEIRGYTYNSCYGSFACSPECVLYVPEESLHEYRQSRWGAVFKVVKAL